MTILAVRGWEGMSESESEFERVAARGAQHITRLAAQIPEAQTDGRRADLVRQIARLTEQILAAAGPDDPQGDLVRHWAAAGHRPTGSGATDPRHAGAR
ncbi:hypothetical protein [Streptomyces cyaneofuscatus]|uniref:hypothetical protein n=1 Tax=Streptomyces cyaneofuscatus TaxID=66883 RepID=UPI003669D684